MLHARSITPAEARGLEVMQINSGDCTRTRHLFMRMCERLASSDEPDSARDESYAKPALQADLLMQDKFRDQRQQNVAD